VTEHPSGIHRVRYGSVTPDDRKALGDYLRALEGTEVSGLGREEQKAYWINLYNALTVMVVLDRYPVGSIRDIDISPGLFRRGPWGAKLLTIQGRKVSLDDIEHRILRPLWKDSRIHYAVNCASLGCPNLQPEAYTRANTESLLEKGAREFVNHPRGVRLEGTGSASPPSTAGSGRFRGSGGIGAAASAKARRTRAFGEVDGVPRKDLVRLRLADQRTIESAVP
jgi:hypothetical protein